MNKRTNKRSNLKKEHLKEHCKFEIGGCYELDYTQQEREEEMKSPFGVKLRSDIKIKILDIRDGWIKYYYVDASPQLWRSKKINKIQYLFHKVECDRG